MAKENQFNARQQQQRCYQAPSQQKWGESNLLPHDVFRCVCVCVCTNARHTAKWKQNSNRESSTNQILKNRHTIHRTEPKGKEVSMKAIGVGNEMKRKYFSVTFALWNSWFFICYCCCGGCFYCCCYCYCCWCWCWWWSSSPWWLYCGRLYSLYVHDIPARQLMHAAHCSIQWLPCNCNSNINIETI